MNASEVRARLDATEALLTALLDASGRQTGILNDLKRNASTPEETWMAEWWWVHTAPNVPDQQTLDDLEQRRVAIFGA